MPHTCAGPSLQFTGLQTSDTPQAGRQWRIHTRTRHDLDELAAMVNPVVAGWMNYYGRFYRSQLYPLLQRINTYLMRWAGKKYRHLPGRRRLSATGPGTWPTHHWHVSPGCPRNRQPDMRE
jgi:hypothetical protein